MAAYTTIDDPSAYFKVQLYTGNGSTNAITFDDTDTNMQPDFVWLKNRNSSAHDHFLFDSVNGVQQFLSSNDTGALASADSTYLTAFNSDGFTLGSSDGMNENTITFVSWNWKAGTTSGITTNGSTTITPSSYSFSSTSGFSILKYTGNSTAGAKLAHGLGGCDAFWIKRTAAAGDDWRIYSGALGGTKNIKLNSNDAAATGTNIFNDTDADSVNITLGSHNSANASDAMICYAFKSIQGFSKFGTYIGNNNSDGAYVYLGFRPAWLMIRRTDASSSDWVIMDNKRLGYNPDFRINYANLANNEEAYPELDFLSNGFKLRGAGALTNDPNTYFYMAFAEAPFVNSNGVPCNAR